MLFIGRLLLDTIVFGYGCRLFAEWSGYVCDPPTGADFNRFTIPAGILLGMFCLMGYPRVRPIYFNTVNITSPLRLAVFVGIISLAQNRGENLVAICCVTFSTCLWVLSVREHFHHFARARQRRVKGRTATA
ncbi:MAG: hypothetical protein JST35_10215 [Armatimonadetes bacterium]|nr:hypothetical protein [Armatimonadota bacterium]